MMNHTRGMCVSCTGRISHYTRLGKAAVEKYGARLKISNARFKLMEDFVSSKDEFWHRASRAVKVLRRAQRRKKAA